MVTFSNCNFVLTWKQSKTTPRQTQRAIPISAWKPSLTQSLARSQKDPPSLSLSFLSLPPAGLSATSAPRLNQKQPQLRLWALCSACSPSPLRGHALQRELRGTTGDSQGTRPQAGQGDSECPGAIPALPRAERATHLTCPWPTVCAPLLRGGCAERGGGSQQLARASRGRGGCSHSPGAARPRLIRQRQLQAEARGATPRIHMVWWDSAAG